MMQAAVTCPALPVHKIADRLPWNTAKSAMKTKKTCLAIARFGLSIVARNRRDINPLQRGSAGRVTIRHSVGTRSFSGMNRAGIFMSLRTKPAPVARGAADNVGTQSRGHQGDAHLRQHGGHRDEKRLDKRLFGRF